MPSKRYTKTILLLTAIVFVGVGLIYLQTDQASAATDEGLEAHWQFDDQSGQTASDSVGNHDAKLDGSVSWTDGKKGGGLSFTGGHLETEHTDTFNNRSFTVSFWMKPVQINSSGAMVAVGGNLGDCSSGWAFGHTKDAFKFKYCDSSSVDHQITDLSWDKVNQDQWQHVALTMEDVEEVAFYLNGKLLSRSPAFRLKHSPTHVMKIGNQQNEGNAFRGGLDEVRYYDRSLSTDEIKELAGKATDQSVASTTDSTEDTQALIQFRDFLERIKQLLLKLAE